MKSTQKQFDHQQDTQVEVQVRMQSPHLCKLHQRYASALVVEKEEEA